VNIGVFNCVSQSLTTNGLSQIVHTNSKTSENGVRSFTCNFIIETLDDTRDANTLRVLTNYTNIITQQILTYNKFNCIFRKITSTGATAPERTVITSDQITTTLFYNCIFINEFNNAASNCVQFPNINNASPIVIEFNRCTFYTTNIGASAILIPTNCTNMTVHVRNCTFIGPGTHILNNSTIAPASIVLSSGNQAINGTPFGGAGTVTSIPVSF
jgi:hypothetical protein